MESVASLSESSLEQSEPPSSALHRQASPVFPMAGCKLVLQAPPDVSLQPCWDSGSRVYLVVLAGTI